MVTTHCIVRYLFTQVCDHCPSNIGSISNSYDTYLIKGVHSPGSRLKLQTKWSSRNTLPGHVRSQTIFSSETDVRYHPFCMKMLWFGGLPFYWDFQPPMCSVPRSSYQHMSFRNLSEGWAPKRVSGAPLVEFAPAIMWLPIYVHIGHPVFRCIVYGIKGISPSFYFKEISFSILEDI